VGACVAVSWGTCALVSAAVYGIGVQQNGFTRRGLAFNAITIGWGAKVGYLTRGVRFARPWGPYAFNGLYAFPSALCTASWRCP
jgi:hypothetical protein